MANIQINELPLVNTATATDVLVINVNNQITSAITYSDFRADLNIFTKPGYFPDGTAVSPSISFENDQNTGFFRPGNDAVGVTTAGTQRAVFNGIGNFGVGVNDPLSRVQIAGDLRVDVNQTSTVVLNESATSSDPLFSTLTQIPLLFGVNQGEKMRIDADGNVLIGTTTNADTAKLKVAGSVQVQEAIISNGGTTNNLKFEANSVDFLQFNAVGAAQFSGSYGTDGFVLVSSGDGAPPVWANIETDPSTFDFRQLPNIADAP